MSQGTSVVYHQRRKKASGENAKRHNQVYANSIAKSRDGEKVKVHIKKKKKLSKKPAAAPPMTPAIEEHVQQPGEEDQPAPEPASDQPKRRKMHKGH